MLNEAEQHAKADTKEPVLEEITYKRKKNKRTKDELIADLPIVEQHYEIADTTCDKCGDELHEMSTRTRDEIEIIPAKVIVKRHIQHIYICRNCKKTDIKANIVSAKMPKPLIKGALASPSAVSHIITQKYMNAMPLYR